MATFMRATNLKNQRLALTSAICLSVASTSAQVASAQDSFSYLPGNSTQSGSTYVFDLSANGQFAVGWAPVGLVIWDRGVPSVIHESPNAGFATSVSADGRVVAGMLPNASSQGLRAFSWSEATGIERLPFPQRIRDADADYESYAWDVSDDGRTVVGGIHANLGSTTSTSLDEGLVLATVWTDGNVETLPGLDPSATVENNEANGISGDGSTIVGYSSLNSEWRAVRWVGAERTIENLDTLGGTMSNAVDVSANGDVVVGWSFLGSTWASQRAFRWTEQTGMVNLGTLQGLPSEAEAVSADGGVVVGTVDPSGSPIAFRWNQQTGMISVADWLSENGVEVSRPEDLASATGTNADGSIVIGNSRHLSNTRNSRAWMAQVDADLGAGFIPDLLLFENQVRSSMAASQRALQNVAALSLFGAHHRPLRLSGFTNTRDGQCAWATADYARHSDSDTTTRLAEVGACTEIGRSQLGIGVGAVQARQGLPFGGSTDVDGQYLLFEADYLLPANLLVSTLGYYGDFDTDRSRRYVNGDQVDSSLGSNDATGTALRLRGDWIDGLQLGDLPITPFASYTWSRTEQDAYQEQGGAFPMAYDSTEWESHDVRVGLSSDLRLTDMTSLHLAVEAAHRIDEDDTVLNAKYIGIDRTISAMAPKTEQTWGRFTLDLDHQITQQHGVTLGVSGATDGAAPSWGITVGWRGRF